MPALSYALKVNFELASGVHPRSTGFVTKDVKCCGELRVSRRTIEDIKECTSCVTVLTALQNNSCGYPYSHSLEHTETASTPPELSMDSRPSNCHANSNRVSSRSHMNVPRPQARRYPTIPPDDPQRPPRMATALITLSSPALTASCSCLFPNCSAFRYMLA